MNYLIVVAHPDDEVLGAGGTMFAKSRRGDNVDVCIMVGGVAARHLRPGDDELESDSSALPLVHTVFRILDDMTNPLIHFDLSFGEFWHVLSYAKHRLF